MIYDALLITLGVLEGRRNNLTKEANSPECPEDRTQYLMGHAEGIKEVMSLIAAMLPQAEKEYDGFEDKLEMRTQVLENRIQSLLEVLQNLSSFVGAGGLSCRADDVPPEKWEARIRAGIDNLLLPLQNEIQKLHALGFNA
jgi:hypothetical protein